MSDKINNELIERDISKHEQWMRRALLLAEKAREIGEVPVGAILVKNNKIIGQGFNQPISQNDPTAHAEIMALRQAGKALQNYRLVDTTMYITLEPCAMCAMAMVHARVKTLVFATREPRAGAGGSVHQLLDHAAHNHRIDVVEGVLKRQSMTLLKEFFKEKRRK